MTWLSKKDPYPAHYEEYVGRKHGYTLRVRGPRGGSVYKWTIERVEPGTQAHLACAHGTSVTRDMAQHVAERRAEHLHEQRQPS